jgi:tetratricopeptide (TPR) repeat protein
VTLPGLRAKVLMTTRLRPRIVEGHGEELLLGCCERELTQMDPADAVAFFRGQGVRGGRAEIEAACAPYGYHPLSLRLLAGLVANDLRQPGDIAAARRLDVSGDLIQRQHHVLEQAYESLTPDRQRLLSRIACFRGPVGYEALAALADASPSPERERGQGGEGASRSGLLSRLFSRPRARTGDDKPGPRDLNADLHDLLARGLLHRDHKTNRFDLHPIVRRYAYDRLAGGDRTAAHRRLRDYFAAVPPPEWVRTLDDLAPVIELYHHTVRAGQYDTACDLFYERIEKATYFQFGAYPLHIELLAGLFPDGEGKPPRLAKESDQAWALNSLAIAYSLSGQPARAVPLVEAQNRLQEKAGDKKNFDIGLGNLAYLQIAIGALAAAEANLRRCIALCREIEDERNEAIGHQELGRLLAYRGAWAETERELDAALGLFLKTRSTKDWISKSWAYRSFQALLMSNASYAFECAKKALAFSVEDAQEDYPLERDFIRDYWLLGAALRAAGPSTGEGRGGLDEADRYLTEALARCRGINAVDAEADILLDLARVRREQLKHGDTGTRRRGDDLAAEASRLAEEALLITERSGYVLQGADVHLFLAEMEIERGDRERALEHAREARRLATCDGPPDYTYKVAYDEAGALLAQLGEGGSE